MVQALIEVLSVEDNADDRAFIEEVLLGIDPEIRLTFKHDAQSAIESLRENFFDFLVLDLRIPFSDDNPMETDPDHGVSVLSEARSSAPGLPILIFTSSEYESLVRTFMLAGDKQDIWGCGSKKLTVDLVRKDNRNDFAAATKELVSDIKALGDCDHRNRPETNLPIDADRLIRIAVRRLGGASYDVEVLGDGKSSADVFSVQVRDKAGKGIFSLVLKIDTHVKTADEHRRYHLHAQQLNSGDTPRLLERLEFGGHARSALIYNLVSEAEGNLFALAGDGPRAKAILENLASILEPWHAVDGETAMTIGDIREGNLRGERAAKVIAEFGLDWADALESRSVQTKNSLTHGDLHGGNVLVDAENKPALIDFNDIESRPAVFDWISLEFSLLFNVDGPAKGSGWPTIDQCGEWIDLDAFVDSCPFEDFVRSCRENALKVCTGERELCAVAYAYLIRQLWYDDTNKDQLKALIQCVRQRLQVL